MSRVEEIRRTVEDYRTAELITGALQDISATKMQSIRKLFEQNIRFFSGIREVYGLIKAHALKEKVGQSAGEEKRERDIYIALTSNKRFYGTLNRDITRAFMHMKNSVHDGVFLVIGQTGAQYIDLSAPDSNVERLQFADDIPTFEERQALLERINSYARVFVIYPKFVNPFRQDVAMTDVTQTPGAEPDPALEAEYIFEPEIPRMLAFFEAQVRHALFERVMLEAELARTAARTVRMRGAKDRATDLRILNERNMKREFATMADIELMETVSSFSFWRQ